MNKIKLKNHFVGIGEGNNILYHLCNKKIDGLFTSISSIQDIEKIYNKDERFVIITTLGFTNIDTLLEELVSLLRNKRKAFFVIGITPFPYSSEKQKSYAKQTIKRLQSYPEFKNYILENIDENLTVNEIFIETSEEIYEIVREI